MTRYRTHLLIRGERVACGQAEIHAASRNPAAVTCGKCLASIHTADAEARAALTRKRRP